MGEGGGGRTDLRDLLDEAPDAGHGPAVPQVGHQDVAVLGHQSCFYSRGAQPISFAAKSDKAKCIIQSWKRENCQNDVTSKI